jgi:hypothetical protein
MAKPPKAHDQDQPEQDRSEARVSRRGFLGAALATGAAMLAGGENTAEAADQKPQKTKPFMMKTRSKSWEDPVNDTLDTILQDPIEYPGRQEIGFVPPPGNKVPTYVRGVPVPYNVMVALNQSQTFQNLDLDTKKKVVEIYNIRHSYAQEHEQFRIQQHNALVGGKAPYPILYEKIIGKPLKEDGTPDEKSRDVPLGYVCKPAGNDTADEKLPYYAFDDRSYEMNGTLQGNDPDRKLVVEMKMKLNGLGFSYGHMEGCEVTYVRKEGKSYKLNVEGDDIHALDPNRVKAAIGVAPEKGDLIRITIPADILRKPLKAKAPMGLNQQGKPEVMYANREDPAHDSQMIAHLQQTTQVAAGLPSTHLDRLASEPSASAGRDLA